MNKNIVYFTVTSDNNFIILFLKILSSFFALIFKTEKNIT